jgi:oligopeptide/dipeptide ABC transporter ATP-binding protein
MLYDMNSVSEHLLRVENLRVEYRTAAESHLALDGVSFEVLRQSVTGVLGESGSGKTTLALALTQLLPRSAKIRSGSIIFQGQELLKLAERQMQRLRGSGIGMIFQQPGLSLNPVLRAVDQIAEVIRAHRAGNTHQRRQEALTLLAEVGLDKDRHVADAYPCELSGGQRQRILIAQALAAGPALLIADEPTASLDAILKLQLKALLKRLQHQRNLSMLFITHNPSDLATFADRVLVLYRGRILEQAGFAQLKTDPLHPYTKFLLRALPFQLNARCRGRNRLHTIAAYAEPAPANGCVFASYCPDRQALCTEKDPPNVQLPDGRQVKCFQYAG